MSEEKVIGVNIVNKKGKKEMIKIILKEPSSEGKPAQITAVRENGKEVGRIFINKTEVPAYYSLNLHSNERGEGIGSVLVESAKNHVRLKNKEKHEKTPIMLTISPYSANGRGKKLKAAQIIKFCEKHGFASKTPKKIMIIKADDIKIQQPRVIGGMDSYAKRAKETKKKQLRRRK